MTNASIQAAYRYCRKKAFGHYENFPVASLFLPQPQRDAVAAVYAFARQADDFADEPAYAKGRERLLRAWAAALNRQDPRPEFVALRDAQHRFGIQKELLKDLVTAFLMDCRKQRYADFGQVLKYCRYSANPVGRLVLRIFKLDSPIRLAASDAICTGLQLANFLQDFASDVQQRNRIYIPFVDLKRFNVKEAQLQVGRVSPELMDLMRFQVERCEGFFKAGEGLPASLPGRLGTEIRLTLLGGRRILAKIRSQNYDTLSKRPKLGWADAPWFGYKLLSGALS